ncbi:MAG: hypothetical protein LBU32_08480 [Clostridiales bacterium]|jgi:hypothetical protein|nr:hypothetical protein [Clostridiales bacterium]
MHEFESFLVPVMESFIAYRQAPGHWNDADNLNIRLFGRHCAALFSGAAELTQEMADGWHRRRNAELLSNSHRERICCFSLC